MLSNIKNMLYASAKKFKKCILESPLGKTNSVWGELGQGAGSLENRERKAGEKCKTQYFHLLSDKILSEISERTGKRKFAFELWRNLPEEVSKTSKAEYRLF